jgi:hypothetical protein
MASHNAFEILTGRLAQYLGPAAATNTVDTLCRQHAGAAPETLTGAQLVRVLPSLQPLLSVLLGTTKTEILLSQLAKDLAR